MNTFAANHHRKSKMPDTLDFVGSESNNHFHLSLQIYRH